VADDIVAGLQVLRDRRRRCVVVRDHGVSHPRRTADDTRLADLAPL
jgi:hypothetical protein